MKLITKNRMLVKAKPSWPGQTVKIPDTFLIAQAFGSIASQDFDVVRYSYILARLLPRACYRVPATACLLPRAC
mgnify:FL=1